MVVFFPVFVSFLVNVKLDCVISSSDGLHIKIDVLNFLYSLDIIIVNQSEEINEYSNAADK